MANPPDVVAVLADGQQHRHHERQRQRQGQQQQRRRLVEVGVGRRPGVAAGLAARGCAVTATDVTEREVPDGVAFVVDDVTDPDRSVYEGADAVYALRCPPELQRPLLAVAESVDAACYFTTLGGDPAVVPAEPLTVASGTLFAARDA